jgi:hypothetical protein
MQFFKFKILIFQIYVYLYHFAKDERFSESMEEGKGFRVYGERGRKGLGFFFCSTNSVVSLTKKIGKILGNLFF